MNSAPQIENHILARTSTMSGGKCGAVFKDTAIALFIIAAVMKLWMVLGDYRIVHESDPILRMPFRSVFSTVALLELACACLLVVRSNRILVWKFLAAFLTLVVIYRVGLWLVDYRLPCSCLGVLPDWLGLSAKAGDWLAKGILAYLTIGVYSVLIFGLYKSN